MTDPPIPVDGDEIAARIGSVIKDKWTLERLLGVGGMAAVYEAKHEIGRRDAIKIMHPAYAADAQLVERFKREAHAVNRFAHPGVVEVRDVDVTSDGLPFLVMELLEGESVGDKLRRGKVGAGEALGWADQLLDLLATAHARGVVHRDIKPSNLFVVEKGLKVLDFGVAKLREAPGKPLTEAGTTLGTVAYMPPEQLEKSDVDERADVFATGATLFELLAGRRIHDETDTEKLARLMINTPAPPLSSVAPDVAAPIAQVIDRALAYRAERRYPNALVMQADLRRAMAGEPPPLAAALLELGDDPRSKKKAAKEVLERIAEAAAAAAAGSEPTEPTREQGEREPDPDPSEDATTVERPTVDDEAPTRKRDIEATAPMLSEQQKAPARWPWLVVALGLAALLFVWRARHESETLAEPEVPPPADTGAATERPLEPVASDPGAGGRAGGRAPAAGSSAAPDPAPAEAARPRPPEKPAARPGLPPLPSAFASALPTALPSVLPTGLPTGLPTTFPTAPPAPAPK